MSPPKPPAKKSGLTGHVIGAALLAGCGVIVLLISLFAGRTSPRGWIPENFDRVAAGTYVSRDTPLTVADRIATRFKTKDRVYTPGGVFLRYHNAVVGILPNGRGSRITVDDPDRGYARYHSSVGGFWGGPGGRVSSFRGGGPGEGGK
jgi:Domain of unknown function (DUF4247)